jgi:hypothetical protein
MRQPYSYILTTLTALSMQAEMQHRLVPALPITAKGTKRPSIWACKGGVKLRLPFEAVKADQEMGRFALGVDYVNHELGGPADHLNFPGTLQAMVSIDSLGDRKPTDSTSRAQKRKSWFEASNV